MFSVLNPKRLCSLSLLLFLHHFITALLKRAFYYINTHHKMASALVSSSSCASTTVCSRRPFHRKSSIKTTKRYVQILSRFDIFSFSFSSRFPAKIY